MTLFSTRMNYPLFAAILWTGSLAGQSYPHQEYFDSLLSSIEGKRSLTDLPASTVCEDSDKHRVRLCQGVLAMRTAELTRSVDDIGIARDLLERIVAEEPKWVAGWYTLGRNRLQAGRSGMVGKEGALLMAGESNDEGAGNALERAVSLDPGYQPAWELLAKSPLSWERQAGLKKRALLLRKGRRYLSAEGIISAALFELDGGSPDTAVAMLRLLLSQDDESTPRGLAQLTYARALYRVGQTRQGRTALFAGASATDSAGIANYHEQLAWVADSSEVAEWDKLIPAARPAWLASFWGARDVREGRKDGERLTEHYRRVNIAFSTYRMVRPFSGEQEYLSFPGEVEFKRQVAQAIRILESAKLIQPDTVAKLNEYLNARADVGSRNTVRALPPQLSMLDDRGVVFIRHGEPTKRLAATPSTIKLPDVNSLVHVDKLDEQGRLMAGHVEDSITIIVPGVKVEVWRYDIAPPSKPLVLYFVSQPFQGSTEPNTLVPTLLTEDPQTRSQLCPIDPDLCPVTSSFMDEVVAGRMSIDRISSARLAGLETIQAAVTTDNFTRSFAKVLSAWTQTSVLELAGGGSPRLVFAFALPGEQLKGTATAGKTDVTYPVKVEMSAVRLGDAKRVERDTTRQYVMPHMLAKGEYLSGLMELRLAPGTWLASIAVTQADGAGAVMRSEEIRVLEYSTHLRISDLVLGNDSAGLRWHSGAGGQPVPMNPLNTYRVGSSVAIYAQIGGLTEKTSYQAKFEIFEGREAKGTAALTIAFDEMPSAERVELSRVMSLNSLKTGRYLVRLTVVSGEQTAVATGGLEIVK